YDELHRPTERGLRVRDENTGTTGEFLIERFRYGESAPNASASNLRGRGWQHYDCSGLAQVDAVDLSGNPLTSRRRLARDIEAALIDWEDVQLADVHGTAAAFSAEVFTQRAEYDALGRITRLYNWHVESPANSGRSDRVSVYLPEYNERGLLARETLLVRARKSPTGHTKVAGVTREE